MPNFDKTGHNGDGPQTGGKRGIKTPQPKQENDQRPKDGRGRGRGRRNK